jgi:2-methylcitrate dehydratase
VEALARALAARDVPEAARLLRPCVPGAVMPGGARIPGTSLELDPAQAAFATGLLMGWECGPTTVAGDPCQHVGPVLAVADYLARKALMEGQAPLTVRDVLGALLAAHEIQAGLARLDPPLHGAGDPTLLLKVAQTAVIAALLGADTAQIACAVTHAFLDGPVLPVPHEGAGTGTRHRWAAADAAGRAVRLALWTLAGEMGYPRALEAGAYGYCDVVLAGRRPQAPPSFGGGLGERPEGAEGAVMRLAAAAAAAFQPRQAERIRALLAQPLARLDARPVSELMAQLVTHAVRESSQLALL